MVKKKVDKRSKEWREAKAIAHKVELPLDINQPHYEKFYERETYKAYKNIINKSYEITDVEVTSINIELDNGESINVAEIESKDVKKETDINTLENIETPAQGLGDTIEKFLKVTKIKDVVNYFMDGKDCKCAERRKKLNKVFSYKAQCLEEKEYDFIKKYNERHDPDKFSREDVFQLGRIHQRVFKLRISVCSNCPSGVKSINQIVTNLNKMVDLYDEN